jgi:hypothetical protein
MTIPQSLWSDERIGELIKSVLMDEPNHTPRGLVRRVSYIIRTDYEAELVRLRTAAIAAWNRRCGSWQPLRHDDPYFNDSPVWLDENGCVCWAGANGETERLVLFGDMKLCMFVEGEL